MRVGRYALGVSLILCAGAAIAATAKDDADPLAKGTIWKGKLTQKGKIEGKEEPLTLEATLTITKREGTEFWGDLYEKGAGTVEIELTYLVRGNVVPATEGKDFTVKFTSENSRDAKSRVFLKVPYTGTLAGKTLTGTWKHQDDVLGAAIEGDFSLELKGEAGGRDID